MKSFWKCITDWCSKDKSLEIEQLRREVQRLNEVNQKLDPYNIDGLSTCGGNGEFPIDEGVIEAIGKRHERALIELRAENLRLWHTNVALRNELTKLWNRVIK